MSMFYHRKGFVIITLFVFTIPACSSKYVIRDSNRNELYQKIYDTTKNHKGYIRLTNGQELTGYKIQAAKDSTELWRKSDTWFK